MSIKVREKYSPYYCGYPAKNPEYFELRWDLVDCILGCEFWSPASRPKKMKESIVEFDPSKIVNETKRKWVEPLRMSPIGLWENVLKRCGPEGAGLLKHFPKAVANNLQSIFPSKPEGYEYASGIVNKRYW